MLIHFPYRYAIHKPWLNGIQSFRKVHNGINQLYILNLDLTIILIASVEAIIVSMIIHVYLLVPANF